MQTDIFGWKRRQKRKLKASEAAVSAALEKVDTNTPDEQQGVQGDEQDGGAAILGETYTAEALPAATVLTPEDIDKMDIDEVKGFLDQSEIKYAHNTGVVKLREYLKDAIV